MFHVGIDYHKKYSVASVIDEAGVLVKESRIEGNSQEGFSRFFAGLGEDSRVVLEASWNWGSLYDCLEEVNGIEEIVLAHPYKTRIIAEAQIKTDRLDARILAQLLRANLIPKAHIPDRSTRQKKDILRQRLFWVCERTKLRNRIHTLIDRQRGLSKPQVSDLFGKKGIAFLNSVQLPEPDARLLRQDMEVIKVLNEEIKEIEKQISEQSNNDLRVRYVLSIPGMGNILSNVVVTEIDDIERFPTSSKLCSYAGVVPTTYASGGKEYHGSLVPRCNKWLRWALIEGAWVAIGCSGYFGAFYRQHRNRGKGANEAIIITAHRLCQIVWKVLKEERFYEERPFTVFSSGRSDARLAV